MALKDLDETQKNKLSGVGGTIIFHALLLIFLLMTNLTTKVPYPEPGGIEVAMGSPEEGGPDYLPASNVEENTTIPQTNSAPDDQLTTTDDDDAPDTEVKKDADPNDANKKSDKPVKTDNNTNVSGNNTTTDKPKKDNPFKLGNDQSDGRGKGEKPGNGGEEWGKGDDPNGTFGNGNPGPGGYDKGSEGLSVIGRRLVSKPTLKSSVTKEERVGVKITVDPDGKVISARAGFEKSTTTDKQLWKEAEEMAKKIVYSASTDGKSSTAIIVIRFRPQ